MGLTASHSLNPVFKTIRTSPYAPIIDYIDTESATRVYNRLTEFRFSTKQEMVVVSTLIFDKVLRNPSLALKCTHLLEELSFECSRFESEIFIFNEVFNEHISGVFLIFMTQFASKQNQPALSPEKLEGVEGAAALMAHIQSAKLCMNTLMLTLDMVKLRCGQIGELFTRKMEEHMNDSLKNDRGFGRGIIQDRSYKLLDQSSNRGILGCFEILRKFDGMTIIDAQIYTSMLFKFCMKYKRSLNICCDIALKIHRIYPETLIACLRSELHRAIEFFEVIKDLQNEENLIKCQQLCSVVIELYNYQLIGNDTVEYFMDTVKNRKIYPTIFAVTIFEVLRSYSGPKLTEYVQYFKDISKRNEEINVVCRLIEGYALHEVKKSNLSIAAHPDIHEYLFKKESTTFMCEKQPSCHFASKRSVDMLMRHIGHKFFTPERIQICTKMTRDMMNVSSKAKIDAKFECETLAYYPYFQPEIKPCRKFKNFTLLLAEFFAEDLIMAFTFEEWMENIKNQVRFYQNLRTDYFELFKHSFRRSSTRILINSPEMWLDMTKFIDTIEFTDCGFNDFEIFRQFVENSDQNSETRTTKLLKRIEIPNNSTAMRMTSKILLNSYVNETITVTSFSTILQAVSKKLHKNFGQNTFQWEFEHALDHKWKYTCAIYSGPESTGHKHAMLLVELMEMLCSKSQINLVGYSRILSCMSEMFPKNPESTYALIKMCISKTSTFYKKLNSDRGLLSGMNSLKEIFSKVALTDDQQNEEPKKKKKKNKKSRKSSSSTDGSEAVVELKPEEIANDLAEIAQNSGEGSQNVVDLKSKVVTSSETDASTGEEAKEIPKNPKRKNRKPRKPKNKQQVIESNSEIERSSSEDLPLKNRQEPKKLQNIQIDDQVPSTSSSSNPQKNSKKIKPKTKRYSSLESSESEAAKEPELSYENVKNYKQFCTYYTKVNHMDHITELFEPTFIISLNISTLEEVTDFSSKIIKCVSNDDENDHVSFLTQSTLKIGNAFDQFLRPQNTSFRNLIINEASLKFQQQTNLVRFMCELFNQDYVSKAFMVEFVDKFKSKDPKDLVLLQIFVEKCMSKLLKQGDKQQMEQIKMIANSTIFSREIPDDVKFLVQDLLKKSNVISSMINLKESNKVRVESSRKIRETPETLLKNALRNPQEEAKNAKELEPKHKETLIQKCQNYFKDFPKIKISFEEFLNFIRFIAELYNLDILESDFIMTIIETFLDFSTQEISYKSLEVLFENCGSKLENQRKSKLKIIFKFFQFVVDQKENSSRAVYFKKFVELKANNWKILAVPEDFYEEFLMLYSINNAKVEELTYSLNKDRKEILKFIQALWKVLLKEAPNPSYANLCSELSKTCNNFVPTLAAFLTARCNTFTNLEDGFYSENVKERLGKVVKFVAELYNHGLISDDDLEMWINEDLVEKIPAKLVGIIFKILINLKNSKNFRLSFLFKNLENNFYNKISSSLQSNVDSLKELNEFMRGQIDGRSV